MLSAWFKSAKRNDDADGVASAEPHVADSADKCVDETLVELERLQTERLDALMEKLMQRQRSVLKRLAENAIRSENNAALRTAGLQDFLIKGALMDPAQAVQLRQQSIDKYLHDFHREELPASHGEKT